MSRPVQRAQALRIVPRLTTAFALLLFLSGITSWAKVLTAENAPPGATTSAQKKAGNTEVLKLRKPLERQIQPGETHNFEARAEAGSFLHVKVDQEGIDVKVTLFAADGRQFMVMDSLNGAHGVEPISTVAETTGIYRIAVEAAGKDAQPGRYRIELTDLHAATSEDLIRIKAERAYMVGVQSYPPKGTDAAKPILKSWEEAARYWGEVHDDYEEALTLSNIASIYSRLGQKETALEYYKRALPLAHDSGDHGREAATLFAIGEVNEKLGRSTDALAALDQTRNLCHEWKDRNCEANSLRGLGRHYEGSKDQQRALESYQEERKLFHQQSDRSGEASALVRIGNIYAGLDEKQKALDSYSQARGLLEKGKFPAEEAITLNLTGGVYKSLGEWQNALNAYNQALPLWHEAGDRELEGVTLSEIAQVYRGLGDRQKTLSYFQQALPLLHAAGARDNEADVLYRTGAELEEAREYSKAQDYLNQALTLQRASGDPQKEARTLHAIALGYEETNEPRKALDYYTQALAARRSGGDKHGEAITLNNLGGVSEHLGEYQKALDYYNQSLSLRREVGDRRGEANTLNNIGLVYITLGEPRKALQYHAEALPLRRAVGDRKGEAVTLGNMGIVYDSLNQPQKAMEYFEQSLPLRRAADDKKGEAATLNSMGLVFRELGKKQEAFDHLNQALQIERAIGDRYFEGSTLQNLGAAYAFAGDQSKALEYYALSLQVRRSIEDVRGEASTLSNLMYAWNKNGKPVVAIFFGKQAVNLYQQLRRNIRGLDKEVQEDFVHSKKRTYRKLAELLIAQGRLPEAQQVLDALKDQEYFDFIRRDTRGGASERQQISTTPEEQALDKKFREVSGQVAEAGEKWSALQAKASRTPEEEKELAELADKLQTANQAMDKFYDELYRELGKTANAANTIEQTKEKASGLQNLLQDMPEGTVGIYTLVGEDAYHAIVVTRNVMLPREYKISARDLRLKVENFRDILRNPNSDPLPKARALYNILIGPIAGDLESVHAKTLMWSLDDVLRYVPMAALYDGQSYLVEKYRNELFTSASLPNLASPTHVTTWRGVGLGSSLGFGDLQPLPSVPGELHQVIRDTQAGSTEGAVPGTIMLDAAFTKKTLEQALSQKYPLVHIASHFSFNPGDETDSFLLLGGKDGEDRARRLTLADIRDDPMLTFRNVELLTLSACDTAAGGTSEDGREIDGFGRLAQQKGAKAVVASLWEVDDASTGLLMRDFYTDWTSHTAMSKAEALRRAQMLLLHGGANSTGKAAVYSHPYFWAPFILIGNWQ